MILSLYLFDIPLLVLAGFLISTNPTTAALLIGLYAIASLPNKDWAWRGTIRLEYQTIWLLKVTRGIVISAGIIAFILFTNWYLVLMFLIGVIFEIREICVYEY